MKIIRKVTHQGHPVPAHAHAPRGPFTPELFHQAPIKYPEEHPSAGPGELYSCRGCGAHLFEDELTDHRCDDEETE